MSEAVAIIPSFRYKDARAAIKFLCEAFGFQEHLVVPGADGKIAHAELTLGSGLMIMLGSADNPSPLDEHMVLPADVGGRCSSCLFIQLTNVDEHYERAKKAGAQIVRELTEVNYQEGAKDYVCKD